MDSRAVFFFLWLKYAYKSMTGRKASKAIVVFKGFREVSFVFVISVAIFLHRFLFFYHGFRWEGTSHGYLKHGRGRRINFFAKSLLVGA